MLDKQDRFCAWPGRFKASPLLQERIVYVGQLEVYEQASELLERLSGVRVSDSAIYRMDYKSYRQQGLMIGSGAIGAALRTLVQQRMKLAGKQWSDEGANNLLNLRVCKMSGKWPLLLRHIKNKNMAETKRYITPYWKPSRKKSYSKVAEFLYFLLI